jgi:hypothetical protein
MTKLVRSTLTGISLENPDRPQQERGGSPQDVLARVLFTAEGAAQETALRQIEATLSEIRQSTPSVVTEAVVSPVDAPQQVFRQSAYVRESNVPAVAETAAVVAAEEKPRFLGIFERKSAAQLYQERQARRKAA